MLNIAVILLGVGVYEGYALQCWTCSSDIDRFCADHFNASDWRFGYYNQPGYQSGSGYNQPPYDPYNARAGAYDPNRDNRNRDYNSRDPNARDPYFDRDRTRDPYNNRDYNNRDYNTRDPNYRDGNRDPYHDRDPSYRDGNNRDYPPRDYNRDYNQQGRSYDPNYPNRDYQRPQAQLGQAGPRLVTCSEEDARASRMRNVCIKKVQRYGINEVTYIRRCQMIPYEKEVGTCYDAVARGLSLDFCEYCEYDGCNSATGLKFDIIVASLIPLALLWACLS